MKTDLTKEQIERGREFLKDLRANPKKCKDDMRDTEGGRCCLCVAYDTAQNLGAALPELSCSLNGLPPIDIAEFYGWPSENPLLSGQMATWLNDGLNGSREHSHAEIADLFEAEYPQLKLP